jgi:hypothetical protein
MPEACGQGINCLRRKALSYRREAMGSFLAGVWHAKKFILPIL